MTQLAIGSNLEAYQSFAFTLFLISIKNVDVWASSYDA